MLKNKNISNMEDIVSCQICSGILRKPKILDCQHSFCEKCLKGIQSRLSAVSRSEFKFTCPVCDTITFKNGGVANLRDDIKSIQIIAVLEGEANDEAEDINQNPTPNCNICDGQGEVSCIECELVLCHTCKTEHADDPSEGGKHATLALKLGILCISHPNRQKKVYCHDCDLSLCQVCMHKHEKSHTKTPVQKYFQFSNALLEESKSLEAVASKFKENLEKYEAARDVQESIIEDAKTALAKQTSQAEFKLSKVKKDAMETLDQMREAFGFFSQDSSMNAAEKIDQLMEDLKKTANGSLEDNLRRYSQLMKLSTDAKALSVQVDGIPAPEHAKDAIVNNLTGVVEKYVEGVREAIEKISIDGILEEMEIGILQQCPPPDQHCHSDPKGHCPPEEKCHPDPDGKYPPALNGKCSPTPDEKCSPTPDGKCSLSPNGKCSPVPDGKCSPIPEEKYPPTPDGKCPPTPDGKCTPPSDGKQEEPLPEGNKDEPIN